MKKEEFNTPTEDEIMAICLDFINEENKKMEEIGFKKNYLGDMFLCGLQNGMILMLEEIKKRNNL